MAHLQPLVTVLIPCRNEEENIAKVIENIYKSEYDIARLEVIVVDGLSNDNTKNILNALQKAYPNLKIVDNASKITPVAFNLGLKLANGEYFITVGARHFIDSNYICECVNILKSNEIIACVGGISICVEPSNKGQIIAKAMSLKFGVGTGNFRTSKSSGYVDTVGTPMYRKSALFQVGLFDENLVRNQDDELSYRLLKNNYKVFQTNKTTVKYKTRNTFSNLLKQLFQYGYWKIFVNKKHATVTTLRQIIPGLFVLYLITELLLVLLYFTLHLSDTVLIFSLFPLLSYIMISFLTSILMSTNKKNTLVSMYCFLIMHLSYGMGYITGIIDFLILNKEPSEKNKALTR